MSTKKSIKDKAVSDLKRSRHIDSYLEILADFRGLSIEKVGLYYDIAMKDKQIKKLMGERQVLSSALDCKNKKLRNIEERIVTLAKRDADGG